MDFDNFSKFEETDQANMLGEIRDLPNQLETTWEMGQQYQIPEKVNFDQITIAGMGGSAIGADIIGGYTNDISEIPIRVLRGYDLPRFVSGERSLVICSSHSGNTEETLSVFNQAISRKCTVIAISTGGELEERANMTNTIFWKFQHVGQPRSAIGFSFGLLYCLFSRISIIPDQKKDIEQVSNSLNNSFNKWDTAIPAVQNLAKRIAGQSIGRTPIFFGAEHLEPVARRWKTQANELAKTIAGFEFLPEANHNSLAGLEFPEEMLQGFYAIFLNSRYYHERNKKRIRLTATEYMVSGVCTDQVTLEAKSKLDEIWQMILLGDFVTYYLAIAYQVDPTPIERLDSFKQAMRD